MMLTVNVVVSYQLIMTALKMDLDTAITQK